MRFQIIFRNLGRIFLLNSIFLIISGLISLYHKDTAVLPLFYSAIIGILFGIFPTIFVPPSRYITKHEGLTIVVFGWLSTCVLGMLPYILWGGEFSLTNSWFESVSGFTTTGASILNNIEGLPPGLLFWRSATHWIGGIGIIVFVLVIMPFAGQTSSMLFNTETSTVAKNNFHQNSRQALKIILYVYIGLTLTQSILLYFAGMTVFDAINHSFATVATGGFSTKNTSIAYFNSISIEIIIMVFMFFSGIHFGLLFSTITFKKNHIFNSRIVHYYFLGMIVGIVLIAINLHSHYFSSWADAFRHGAFQAVSLATTTGFASYESNFWPGFSQLILIFFTLQCACAGSTSGGIKVDRVYIFWKTLVQQLKQMAHPNAIISVKIMKRVIDQDIVRNSLIFIVIYIVWVFFSALILTFMDIDIMTSFSAAATTMGNVGPGFAGVSSMGNFHNLPDAAKWLLSLNMILGRLEIFGFFALLMFKNWK